VKLPAFKILSETRHPALYASEVRPPVEPPATDFLMVLRKHLTSGEIVNFHKPLSERILEFSFKTVVPSKELETMFLVVELLPNAPNLILLDAERRVMASFLPMTPQHGIAEYEPYTYPKSGNKIDLERVVHEDIPELTAFNAAAVGVVTVHDEQIPVDEVTVLIIVAVPAGKVAATVTWNGTVVELLAATVTSWVHVLPAASLGVQVQPVPVKVVLAGTFSVRVVDPALPPRSVTVRLYTSVSFGPTVAVGPAGALLTENRVLTTSRTATVGVVTVHDEQVPVDEVTVLTIVAVLAGKVAATVTSNGTVVELLAATVTTCIQVLPAASLGRQVQPVPVRVVLAGTDSVSVVEVGLPPESVTVRW